MFKNIFFNLDVKTSDMKVETKIERMETKASSVSGDYTSGHDDCSIRLVCRAPRGRNSSIEPGSCHFT